MYNCFKEFFVGPKIITLNAGEEYITLQSLLKITGTISTGGMVKSYLAETVVLVNGERENRRGRKLCSGDEIRLPSGVFVIK